MARPYILVLYASTTGHTKRLAEIIQRGIRMVPGVDVHLRTVPSVDQLLAGVESPEAGAPFVTVEELAGASGLALGSSTRFGNMAASLQIFLEKTSGLWFKGLLVDKPVSVFTASSSMHGGQETTLMNMITPLLHHGMVVVGVPYTVAELGKTTTGGTPYGASHVSGPDGGRECDDHEHAIALAQGKRLAKIAKALHKMPSE